MNKDKCKGFVTGLLTAAIVLGLGGAAWAAGRSIQVEDGVAVTVNGVPFTPRDATGKEVPLFAYNGTTYAPIRAFSEAAGLSVDFDAATGTARVETADYAATSDPNSASYIGQARAKEIALGDAGVKSADARFLKSALDWEDGRAVYDVEFCALTDEYDYEIDALTGAIVKKEQELKDYDWSGHDDYRIDRRGDSQTAPVGLLSEEEAKAIALKKLPGAVVVKCELDEDDGRWEYELELRLGGAEYECKLDAKTGEILKWEKDD